MVHRLVAHAFLGRPASPNRCQVNHIDSNKSNNHVENLQYATPAENITHSYASGRAFFSKPVLWRRVGGRDWTKCVSQRQAARELDVPPQEISKCCRQGIGVVADFEVKFANDESPQRAGPTAMSEEEHWKQAIHPKTGDAIHSIMVSSCGRIWRATGRASYGSLHASGYLVTNGKAGYFGMHRLIAATFLGPPSAPSLQVNHVDGNRSNNHISNLEYVTPSENVAHSHFRRAESERGRMGGGQPIYGRRGTDAMWMLFQSKSAAARAANVTVYFVSKSCKDAATLQSGWSFKAAVAADLPDEEWREVILP